MGQGGTLLLVNGTPYDWYLTHVHSHQMNSWPFDNQPTVPAYTSVSVYIEWNEHIDYNHKEDSAEAIFALVGTAHSFQIQARYRYLQVELQAIETAGNAPGSTIGLGWSHDGIMPFILSGTEGNFSSTNTPPAWMQSNLAILGPLTLRQLCIPGSHDAGMYELTAHTVFGDRFNTQTQKCSIGNQLRFGSRYFDCRPVISKGRYLSGHYSDLPEPLGWQGADGESFQDIINEVNEFTATNKELIILNLSHDLNTDTGRDWRSLNQEEWNGLFEHLTQIRDLFPLPPDLPNGDLTQLPLSQFIGDDRAAVVVIVQPDDANVVLGEYALRGFYTYGQLNAYNSYSDTNDLHRMSLDQITKMRAQKTSPDAQEFLLSWTLTQSDVDTVTGHPTILELAAKAHPALYTDVYPACSPDTFPNIIFLDGWDSSDPTALAMAINHKVNA